MGFSNAIRLQFETLRVLAAGAIGGAYATLGDPFANAARGIIIVNGTDGILTFSDDGVNDKFVLLAGTSFIFDIGSNANNPGGSFNMALGTQIYVLGTPTMGSVYLSVIYAGN